MRLLYLSGMAFVAATVAGRLTSYVPTRWLIGPGFLVAGFGLVLLNGITVTSDWTHLIPGLVVSGLGIGLINVPLASTAVGVVRPERAGVASGVNSTFRQIGIATGIATLGSIFSNRVADEITTRLSSTPLAHQADHVASAVTAGQAQQVIGAAPPQLQVTIAQAATRSFVDALNHISAIAAAIAFVAGALCLVLIRQRDFEDHHGHRNAPPRPGEHRVGEPVG